MKRSIGLSKAVSTVAVMGAASCICGALLSDDAKAVLAVAAFAAIVCAWLPIKASLKEVAAKKFGEHDHGDVEPLVENDEEG